MNINLPTLLDVAIGLIFIFFVFSIFVSGIVELINTLIEQRAKLLRRALNKLLGPLADDFFDHQLTKIKKENFFGFMKPVNYLSADSFSTVLIDLLTKPEVPPVVGNKDAHEPIDLSKETFEKIKQILLNSDPKFEKIKELIRPILVKSDSFKDFKKELETWYNGYMEQVSGWFKRYAQGVVWIVAALVAVILNVDTIYLTNRLFTDNDLRDRVVAEAIKTTQTNGQTYKDDSAFGGYLHKHVNTKLVNATAPPKAGEDSIYTVKPDLLNTDKLTVRAAYVQFVQGNIDDLKLPIGWNCSNKASHWLPMQNPVLAVLGWILTAAALSFGAPFWFDLLLKVVNIRNTARRPAGNPDPTK